MKRKTLFLVSVLVFSQAIHRVDGQKPKGTSVEGTVTEWRSNSPLSGVQVQLTPKLQLEPYVVQSESDGRFEFRNIPDGDYLLSAVRTGFLRSEYGKRRSSDPPLTLSVSSSQSIPSLKLSMIPANAISGTVMDTRGEPVPAVLVRAQRLTYDDGEPALQLVQTVATDDLGNYRLYSLPPGRYYVSAVLRANPPVAPSYYPSTSDVRFARIVDLSAGTIAGGTHITAQFEGGVTVQGKVSFTGSAASVQLVPRLPITPASVGSSVAVDGNSGMFRIPNVFPGAYWVIAESDGQSVQTPLEVGSSSVPQIQLSIPRAIDFLAHISFDPAIADPPGFMLRVRQQPPISDRFLFGALSQPIPLLPGGYQILNSAQRSKFYIQSIWLGNADVTYDGLHVDSSPGGTIEIVMGSHPGSLDGIVVNSERQPKSNIVVVLVPDAAHRERIDRYQNVRTDAQGRFKIENIPPGDYVVFSWEDVEPTAWKNASFLKEYETFGKPVRIESDGHHTTQIEAIPEK